ncbi:hypothetical protein LTR95_004034 [Oleoguttula sp. CCFEE 5521]
MPLGRVPQSSYYDAQNRPTAALYRARQPYLIRNTITGLCIMGFVAGVCTSNATEDLDVWNGTDNLVKIATQFEQ